MEVARRWQGGLGGLPEVVRRQRESSSGPGRKGWSGWVDAGGGMCWRSRWSGLAGDGSAAGDGWRRGGARWQGVASGEEVREARRRKVGGSAREARLEVGSPMAGDSKRGEGELRSWGEGRAARWWSEPWGGSPGSVQGDAQPGRLLAGGSRLKGEEVGSGQRGSLPVGFAQEEELVGIPVWYREAHAAKVGRRWMLVEVAGWGARHGWLPAADVVAQGVVQVWQP